MKNVVSHKSKQTKENFHTKEIKLMMVVPIKIPLKHCTTHIV
jgi:hypothetical protein